MEAGIFKQFQDLIYEISGISLNNGKESLVATRIEKRMKILGLSTHKDYLVYLKKNFDGEELIEFLNVISTNVTEFFREADHFYFLENVFKQWSENGQQRFRIWCAASSTGEEPYTLAMIGSTLPAGADLKILATDISTKVIKTAMAGLYPIMDLEDIPVRFRLANFLAKKGGQFAVSDELKRIVSFGRLNLSTPPFPMRGPFDVIFCRNVMIYFDQRVRTRLIREIFRLLRPGGYLMVGHSETLTGIDVPLRSVQPSVYLKEGA